MISAILYKESRTPFNFESLLGILQEKFNVERVHRTHEFLIEFDCTILNRTYRISMSSPEAIFISSELDRGVYEIAKTVQEEVDDIVHLTNMNYAYDIPMAQIDSYEALLATI